MDTHGQTSLAMPPCNLPILTERFVRTLFVGGAKGLRRFFHLAALHKAFARMKLSG